MVLTFLTFLACAGWVGWRAWRGETPLYFGWVDLAFLALALAVFLGASHASYKRPAWLAGWDWLGLALLFLLVRQLAVRPEERHGLVALLLASLVAVSAEGLYQALYELPRQHRAIETFITEESSSSPDQYLPRELAVRGITPTPLELYELQQRLDSGRVYGPYYHPESLATVLALAVPLLVGALIACVRGGGSGWQLCLAAFALLLVLAVLVCTKCWPAMAAVGFVGLLVAGLAWPARLGGRKIGVPLGLLAGAAGVVGLGMAGVFEANLERVREVWPASWRLVLDHLGIGVGPAQFALFYPRYMAETAGAKAVTAGNAVLELWAEAGVFGVLALAALVGLFARAVWRWWHTETSRKRETAAAAPQADAEPTVAWEFYLGGMIGLVLAFILRAGHLPTDDIIPEAVAAGLRAIVWFAAFGVFESLAWSNEEQVGALTAGIAAMFLCLLVQAGIDFASVTVLLWVAVALTLAVVTPEPAARLSRLSAVNALAVPALLAVAFSYFALVFYPAAASVTAMRRSQQAGAFFLSELNKEPKLRSPSFDPIAQLGRAIEPLEAAATDDPGNVRLLVSLSAWYAQLARVTTSSEANPAQLALYAARKAQEANREGPEGYLAEYIWHLNFAKTLLAQADATEKEKPDPKRPTAAADRTRMLGRLRQTAQKRYSDAAKALEAYYRKRDPNDPMIRYLLAEALFGEGRVPDAMEQARQAKRLDEAARPPRNLSNPQRDQVNEWLKRGSGK